MRNGTERSAKRKYAFPTERIITAYTRIAYRLIIAQLLEAIITLSDIRLEELSDIRLEELCQIFILSDSTKFFQKTNIVFCKLPPFQVFITLRDLY